MKSQSLINQAENAARAFSSQVLIVFLFISENDFSVIALRSLRCFLPTRHCHFFISALHHLGFAFSAQNFAREFRSRSDEVGKRETVCSKRLFYMRLVVLSRLHILEIICSQSSHGDVSISKLLTRKLKGNVIFMCAGVVSGVPKPDVSFIIQNNHKESSLCSE